MVLMFQLTV